MIAGTRQTVASNKGYQSNSLYAYAKAFTEAANSILTTETYDLFLEPQKALRSRAVQESLKEFFCENFVDTNDPTLTAEDIDMQMQEAEALFDNDLRAIQESAYQSEYSPMVGMALPIHKLILMNNVFAQGGGIQKVVALQPAFTISLERRILVTPTGQEIDMFLEQNQIADAIEASAPSKEYTLTLPEKGQTDIFGDLGGVAQDELSVQTHISGIYCPQVYIAEGDRLPDADGWFTTKGEIATADQAGYYDVWFPVNIEFTPLYGGPNHLERGLNKPITIKYKSNPAGDIAVLTDVLFGSMDNNVITITNLKGAITQVRLVAKLSTTNAMLETCSVKWRIDTEYVEIPEATPINTTVSPEEVKDVAAMYDANQVTKIMSMTKTALSEKKDMNIKRFLDASFDRLDERTSFLGEFDFAAPEGYALDWVTFRRATFMDYFDDLVARMLQVLNDPNMTVTVYGDPRIVRKITPVEYTYQAPQSIGPMQLDYSRTIVNTADQFVYNFVGSDKLRNTNQLIVILNPKNTERICYRIYDYQFYMSNEIRNHANPSLPAIHSFERFLVKEYQPVQARINILNPSGNAARPQTF